MNQQITKIWQLLENPERWTRGALARDKDGNFVNTGSESAVCWCLLGAAVKVYGNSQPDYRLVISKIANGLDKPISNIAHFNDNSTHTEVLELLKKLDI